MAGQRGIQPVKFIAMRYPEKSRVAVLSPDFSLGGLGLLVCPYAAGVS